METKFNFVDIIAYLVEIWYNICRPRNLGGLYAERNL